MAKLPRSFYTRPDVCLIARELLGTILFTRIGSRITAGRIVETEAYEGPGDRASHAFGNRRTVRTEIMFQEGGIAYVYLCYGIHSLFNIVTNRKEIPHAVLIRAIEPLFGIPHMLRRRGKVQPDLSLGSGPGSLSASLGIEYSRHSGISLLGKTIWIEQEDPGPGIREIGVGTRIGVGYAGPDALLPYRFFLDRNPWVSRAKGMG